jgi:hypothetical protein
VTRGDIRGHGCEEASGCMKYYCFNSVNAHTCCYGQCHTSHCQPKAQQSHACVIKGSFGSQATRTELKYALTFGWVRSVARYTSLQVTALYIYTQGVSKQCTPATSDQTTLKTTSSGCFIQGLR